MVIGEHGLIGQIALNRVVEAFKRGTGCVTTQNLSTEELIVLATYLQDTLG